LPEGAALQQALLQHGGVQCGFCTPGIVMSAHAALSRGPVKDKEALRDQIAGNLCRCTGYQQIIDAVWAVAQARPSENTP
jgi:carbon-monoxide dehydrogenase small subunit